VNLVNSGLFAVVSRWRNEMYYVPVGQHGAGKPSLKQIPHNMYVFCPSCMLSVSTIKSQLSAVVRKLKLHFDILKHMHTTCMCTMIYIIYSVSLAI